MKVEPSHITSEERSELQELHGLCWNTEDDFDDRVPEYVEIMEHHRAMARPHWYLPFHPLLKLKAFDTEIDAYRCAAALNTEVN